MSKVTIADIAREAQVSVTTVSRFINGNYGKMSAATRTRVQDAVTRLDYRPSASAQRMRQRDTHIIGVIVADISNVFSSLLFSGIYGELQPAGYDVMLMNSNNSLDQEHDDINRLLAQQADGLIIQPNARSIHAYDAVTAARTPLVLVDREPDDRPPSVSQVVADNRQACYRLGQQLAGRGYDTIMVFSRTRSEISAQTRRVDGLRAAAQEHGTLLLPIEVGDEDEGWIARTIDVTLKRLQGRTAIVSLMGPLLFDLLAALRRLGLRFPEDVGLVSFDDWQWSQYVRDGIYLLRQDPQEIGRAAAHDLLSQIRGRDAADHADGRSGRDAAASVPTGDRIDTDRTIVLPVRVVDAPSI